MKPIPDYLFGYRICLSLWTTIGRTCSTTFRLGLELERRTSIGRFNHPAVVVSLSLGWWGIGVAYILAKHESDFLTRVNAPHYCDRCKGMAGGQEHDAELYARIAKERDDRYKTANL